MNSSTFKFVFIVIVFLVGIIYSSIYEKNKKEKLFNKIVIQKFSFLILLFIFFMIIISIIAMIINPNEY